jgi:ATP-dependent Clp endopeptidase proteolytic subunit ClpP
VEVEAVSQLRRDDVDRFFDYGVHIPTRTLFMGTETDEFMAESFLKGLSVLEATSTEPITVIMNNIGGDEYHGLAIYDAIATAKSYVTIRVFGHAMSMGSWILQAADDRAMAPNATMMLHYGTWTADGQVRDVRVATAEMERVNRLMEAAYFPRIKAAKPRFTLKQLQALLQADHFLTAPEAVAMGLADRIL